MTTDKRLRLHLDLLRVVLSNYLDHLSQCWHHEGDTTSSVAAVLAAVGRKVEVPREVGARAADVTKTIKRQTTGPLARVADRFDLSLGEEVLIAGAWFGELDPQLGSVFGVLNDDGNRRYPTTGLMHLMCAPFGIDVPVQPRRMLCESLVVSDGPRQAVTLTPVLRELLEGATALSGPASTSTSVPDRLLGFTQVVADLISVNTAPVVVRGVRGSGRSAVARTAAASLGMKVFGAERSQDELRLLSRLGIGVPMLDSVQGAEFEWSAGDGPLVILASPEDSTTSTCVVDVPLPTTEERVRLWAAAARQLRVKDNGLAVRLAEQFNFTETEVDAARQRTTLAAQVADTTPNGADLWTAAQRQPDADLAQVATRIEPVFTFEDLILTDEVVGKLDELVAHVRHRVTVLDSWGFRSRMPRGQGVAALFSGPPGTGKTTAAEAIATELSCELFRIDLSRVVSKYIGETEKNLAIAFREAERSGSILLFDEADALFGKRTDVRDAHDRYANLEVSYLLQRVETFTGLVILSTNKIGNIDEAFQRRLRFVVRFELPNAADRCRLWQKSFPADVPVANLNWCGLASHELTGGHIQTAALSAAFLAAADGGVVTAEHLARAISREYEKLNRAVPHLQGLS